MSMGKLKEDIMYERLLEIISANTNGNELLTILPSSRLREDLGITSLDMFVIICQIEAELSISFDYRSLGKVKTVEDLYKLMEKGKHEG